MRLHSIRRSSALTKKPENAGKKQDTRFKPGVSGNPAGKPKGLRNRATLAVARKLVAYLMAVDRGQTHFLVIDQEARTAA